ncbi:MAG: response regulator transcription factor [Rikenellaceae bacterium]|nr:response regulator transcription factor [Rikenellaceae bacterium]MCL2691881.1 response regulator transcription factor [Rikenellaceae bacterium]
MTYRILLADDEPDILEFVGYNLRREGYEVTTAADGRAAVRAALETLPHLVLLDVMMPGMGGFEACRAMRKHPQLAGTVIAFLTARGEDCSQIEGFDAGGDDYIAKPVRMNVLVSRVKALLKRAEESSADDGSLKIDHERHIVIKDGEQIALPRKEFQLLALLASRPQKVFTRDEIYDKVWGDSVVVGDRTIDVHIRKLREKIGDRHIATVKGVGYKFEF